MVIVVLRKQVMIYIPFGGSVKWCQFRFVTVGRDV